MSVFQAVISLVGSIFMFGTIFSLVIVICTKKQKFYLCASVSALLAAISLTVEMVLMPEQGRLIFILVALYLSYRYFEKGLKLQTK